MGFLFGGVIYRLGDSLFGLRPVGADRFAEDRTGLDHVSFAVDSVADLEAAASMLEDRGITHSGVKDIGAGHILEFRDPDNIALELFAPQARLRRGDGGSHGPACSASRRSSTASPRPTTGSASTCSSPSPARLVEELQPKVGERVVDMGCGRGAVLLPLAAAVGPTGHATGLDLAPRMVAAAAEEAARAGLSVDVVVGDAQEPDLPEQSFDALASSLVLFFLPDPAAALRAWRELLVDGGRIARVDLRPATANRGEPVDAVFGPYLPPGMRDARTTGKEGPFASDAGVERLLSDAGFTDVRTVGDVVPVRFDDADHWHRWTMSTGQRFMWDLVPEGERAAVRARASAAAEDTRRHNADGRIGFDQQVRYTFGEPVRTRGTPLSREPPATSARSR